MVTILRLAVVFMFLLDLNSTLKSQETDLLKEVAERYGAPMLRAFLHERIRVNGEIIEKVKRNLIDLDKSEHYTMDLAEQSLSILDQHLTTLEKAGYFDYNGTENINNFIDQFTMSIEMFPVQVDSQAPLKMDKTVDQLLSTLNVISFDLLINQTKKLITTYIDDIEEKEISKESNRIQKLSAALAKTKLQLLANTSYTEAKRNYRCNDYYYQNSHAYECVNNRSMRYGVEKVLKQVKSIVDLFYAKFNYLGDTSKRSKIVNNQKVELTTPTIVEVPGTRADSDYDD